MKNQYSKSSFHKLYLIEKEMYHRMLQYMNEVDKQEINDLNAEHRPEYEDTDVAVEEDAMSEKEEFGPTDKKEQNDVSKESSTEISHELPREILREGTRESLREASQPSIDEEKLQSSIEEEKLQTPIEEKIISGKEKNVKRPKKYACGICVNKKFTTRSSLKRHHISFHFAQPLHKTVEVETKPKDLTTNSGSNPMYSESKLSTTAKRQREEDELSTHSNEKNARYGNLEYELANTLERRGLKRKGPKRATDLEPRKKFRWESFDGNETNYNTDSGYEANISTPNRGLKRKGPKRATDLEPRKKFRWEAY